MKIFLEVTIEVAYISIVKMTLQE